MNRDDVIRMAREAGFTDHNKFCEVIVRHSNGSWIGVKDELERFAALVAAHEREACAKIVETYRIPVGNSAAGEMACEWTHDALKEIRDSIRARGNK